MDLSNGLYEQPLEVSSLFERFLKDKRFLDNLSERTLKMYKEHLERYTKYSGKPINQKNLNDFVVSMREAGLSPVTCNITIRSMNSFLSWAEASEYLPKLKIKQLRIEKKVMRTVNDAQIEKLLSWKPSNTINDQRAYAIICTMIDCGFRVAEVLDLKVENVLFDSLLIKVKGKGSKERFCPMSLELRKILFRYFNKQRVTKFESPIFFCTSKGTKMSYHNLYRDMKAILDKAGIDKESFDGAFHMWRRKFARNYVKQGGNLFYLQACMGHASLQMTREYVAVETDELKDTHIKTSLLSRLG